MPARKRRVPVVLLGAALMAGLPAAPSLGEPQASTGTLTIRLGAAPTQITIGRSVTVSGLALYSLTGVEGSFAPEAGLPLTLYSGPNAYPGPGQNGDTKIGQTTTAADGSFSFTAIKPTRNTWFNAVPPQYALTSSPEVWVDPSVSLAARSLGPGRTRLSVRVVHITEAGSHTVNARWYVAAKASGRFTPVAATPLRDIASGVGYASAIVDPPARRFQWRVCFNPPWEAAMGPPTVRGPCPDHAFKLPATVDAASSSSGPPARIGSHDRARAAFMFGGEASGTPAPPFPSAGAIAAAESWLNGRAGATALAVVDSSGRLRGIRTRAHFETASVIKVMFLAAYLKRLEAAHRPLNAADRALLYPMIHESNNDAASAVLSAVGEPAVEHVAAEAGMRDYAPGVGWWAFSQTSAADQAQLLWRLGEIMPRRFYPYARYLMSSIEPEQSWGFPPVARPRWQVYFKTGALPSRGLFNEVARLERGGVAFSVAVLTDHGPSQAYGEETIAGVARALLGSG